MSENFFVIKHMKTFLIVLEITFAVLLGLSILLQSRGAGLGSLAGGGGSDGFHSERRGAEKLLFQATIFFAIGFCGIAFFLPFFL